MRVEARYEAKYEGFIYPFETYRTCVCLCVCVCGFQCSIRIIAREKKERETEERYGGSHRKQAEFGPKRVERICLKNTSTISREIFSFSFGGILKKIINRFLDESTDLDEDVTVILRGLEMSKKWSTCLLFHEEFLIVKVLCKIIIC